MNVSEQTMARDLIPDLPPGAKEQHPHLWRDAAARLTDEIGQRSTAIEPLLPAGLYAERLEGVRSAMDARGYDHLVVWGDREHSANLAYLSGFDPRFEEALLVVGPTGDPAVLVGNECEGMAGAAPLPWDLAREWRERTGIRILSGYGTTELFRPVSYLARDPEDRPNAAGRPVPGVEIRTLDDGELMIKTPAVMDAYLGSPDETREVLRDGWFSTGDLARITDGGFVEIVGRKRERILRGGYSIFPSEVEAVLLTHPAVAEAAVVGVPHGELGEEVAAFVTLKPGAALAPDALVDYSRERLAGFKYPRRVTVLDALPKSATGKILKARLG
jgi:hypothetical protein